MITVANTSLTVNEDGQIVLTMTLEIDGKLTGSNERVFTRKVSKGIANEIMRAQEKRDDHAPPR